MEININVIDRKRAYNGFLSVDKVTFQHTKFDGSTSEILTREVVERNDAIAIFLYHPEEDNYWFVEQIRIPTIRNGKGVLTECVAGLVDDGETAEQAAIREVEEEVGYSITTPKHISTFYSTPGGCSEKVVMFYSELKEKVAEGGGLLTEGEDIRIVKYSFSELKEMYSNKEIDDAKTLIGVQWLLLEATLNN
ncbi:NUDIX hydrolase [Flammeovirga sp. SubArs3]|uniref:NUDIX domain-containing protein n=1 Tax=Flammeovirga sp. SubArs3 TaxID=2995316 RepID=UPI00248B26EE|nr:NUDIX hydrolase [Flammeovirga sp. SubArs3]